MAKELIDFDREFAKLFSDPPKDAADADSKVVDLTEFQKYFVKQGRFTAGTETRYRPSIITGEPTWQHLAKGFVIGMRFHSAPVIRLGDARPVHLGHAVEADGRWRLFAFCGAEDPSAQVLRHQFTLRFSSVTGLSGHEIHAQGEQISTA